MNKPLNIIYLGCSGFPAGLAEVERQKLISKSLVACGVKVTVICRKGVHRQTDIPPRGVYEGINYIYTSGTPLKPSGFVKRNFLKFIGIINEFRFMVAESSKHKIDAAIISTMLIPLIFYYKIISRLLGFKIILNYVEYSSAITMRLKLQINNYFYDKYAVRLSDSVIPISDFLEEQVKKINPDKPYIKIPSICDFEKFNIDKSPFPDRYFLYCGVAHYREVIIFIIHSFNLIENDTYCLYLIINGSSASIEKIYEEIELSPKKHLIKTMSKLKYEELVNYYLNACAMLIPLRPTIQDIARFPHKIAEYTASRNPIITTSYGDIKKYFTDTENALVAPLYDENEFSEKMKFVINYPDKAKDIGNKGYDTGYMHFNYLSYGSKIVEMIAGK